VVSRFPVDEKMRTLVTFRKTILIGTFCAALAPVAVVAGIGALQQGGTTAGARRPVTQADMDRWKKELSNWGRWGTDDEKGTLNLITPAKRKQAAGLVRDGITVSLARDASTEKAIDNPQPYQHTMNNVGAAASSDRFSVSFHGLSHTHLDALGHHFLDGKLYNGFSRDEWVTMEGGARKGSIHNVKGGIFTRGILLDIPRLKGVPYLEPGTAIYVEDLEAWEKQAGVKVSAGDAIFIRTGRWVRRATAGPWEIGKLDAGVDASVIPWLRQRDVALIGSESALDVIPIPTANTITNPDDYRPVHNFVLVALGMNVFDNCTLDDLAKAAAARKRWEFLLTASPLPIVNGTGSPINPVAVF
jgi:kynurenine formamidase